MDRHTACGKTCKLVPDLESGWRTLGPHSFQSDCSKNFACLQQILLLLDLKTCVLIAYLIWLQPTWIDFPNSIPSSNKSMIPLLDHDGFTRNRNSMLVSFCGQDSCTLLTRLNDPYPNLDVLPCVGRIPCPKSTIHSNDLNLKVFAFKTDPPSRAIKAKGFARTLGT